MDRSKEELEALLSGYVDGELSEEDEAYIEARLEQSHDLREELSRMREFVTATSSLSFQAPPEEVWDTFLDNVYNRIERRTGWMLFTLGALAISVFGAYHFVVDPWAPAFAKTLVATPILGLGLVFVSVLRQRLFVRKTDRYSREVKR